MTRLHPAPAALLVLAAACASAPDGPLRDVVAAGTVIGEPVRPLEVHRFAELDADPARWFDRTLLVEAEVVAVCRKAGCWMQIADEGRTALVRWETGCGGKYAFPADAVGRRVLVQGSFYRKELSDDDRRHLEEEAGGALAIRPDPYELNASAVVLLDGR